MEYMYTFEVLMGFNGVKGLTEKPFVVTDVVCAKTESEAIRKLNEQNDELGYKLLNIVSLLSVESQKEHAKRVDRELSEIL